jgi:hypothetical protein
LPLARDTAAGFFNAYNKKEFLMDRLRWKRDGADWLLYLDRRRFGRVVPDAKWPGMFRSVLPSGGLSDMANLTRAKNAVYEAAARELEFGARQQRATDPRKCPEKRGVFRHTAPPMRENVQGLVHTMEGNPAAFQCVVDDNARKLRQREEQIEKLRNAHRNFDRVPDSVEKHNWQTALRSMLRRYGAKP